MTRTLGARRALAALAAAPLLVAGLAACGSEGGSGSQAEEPAPAAAAVLTGLHEGDQVDPQEFVATVKDGLDASTTAHTQMTMDLGSSGAMTMQGDVDYTSTPPSMAMTMKLPAGAGVAGSVDVRFVDGIFYMSMGELTQGKFWKIDPSDPKGPFAAMGLGTMMDQLDPAKAMTAMEDGISSVVYVGDEDGLGHYRMTVDLQKGMQALGSQLPKELTSQMPKTLSYDVWLDDQGRFSKMRMDDLPVGPGAKGSMEMTLTGWGEDVDIEAPPADQVTTMPDFGSMGASTPSA